MASWQQHPLSLSLAFIHMHIHNSFPILPLRNLKILGQLRLQFSAVLFPRVSRPSPLTLFIMTKRGISPILSRYPYFFFANHKTERAVVQQETPHLGCTRDARICSTTTAIQSVSSSDVLTFERYPCALP
jgi:hypothetical protein